MFAVMAVPNSSPAALLGRSVLPPLITTIQFPHLNITDNESIWYIGVIFFKLSGLSPHSIRLEKNGYLSWRNRRTTAAIRLTRKSKVQRFTSNILRLVGTRQPAPFENLFSGEDRKMVMLNRNTGVYDSGEQYSMGEGGHG